MPPQSSPQIPHRSDSIDQTKREIGESGMLLNEPTNLAESYDDDDAVFDNESWGARFKRVLSVSRMSRLGEVCGAMGDLGTFLPDVIALSRLGASTIPSPTAFIFFSGFWNFVTGCIFDLPLPIQPMHAVVAISITEGLAYSQIVCAGIALGAAFTILGVSGLVDAMARLIPVPIIRGLQLGLGLNVFCTGAGIAAAPAAAHWVALGPALGASPRNLDGALLCAVAVAVALGSLVAKGPKAAASLTLFCLGVLGVAVAVADPTLSPPLPGLPGLLALPFAPIPQLRGQDWTAGLLRVALPQFPVTLLNAVIATARLSNDLFPRRRTTAAKVAISVGVMNLATGWLGHFPSCHGCGGLSGQYFFGARTGSSMALLGIVKMALAVGLGRNLVGLLSAFPSSVLGVLLALSALELASNYRDVTDKADVALVLLTAGLVLKFGTGFAFLGGVVAALIFWLRRRWDSRTRDTSNAPTPSTRGLEHAPVASTPKRGAHCGGHVDACDAL